MTLFGGSKDWIWAIFGLFWGFWARFGALLAYLGAVGLYFSHFRPILRVEGLDLGHFGGFMPGFGPFLGLFTIDGTIDRIDT